MILRTEQGIGHGTAHIRSLSVEYAGFGSANDFAYTSAQPWRKTLNVRSHSSIPIKCSLVIRYMVLKTYHPPLCEDQP